MSLFFEHKGQRIEADGQWMLIGLMGCDYASLESLVST
jgi:hypothetical protein